MSTLTYQDVLDAFKKVPKPNTDWVLIDPNGTVYKGSVDQLVLLLAKHHPLLRSPIYFSYMELENETTEVDEPGTEPNS